MRILKRLVYLSRLKDYDKLVFRPYSNRNILKLRERGMLQDLFPDSSASEILDLVNSEPQIVYAGFDPTADSLHVGNLLVLVSLIHWQRAGHKVISLIGGATAQIGDPSGRTSERQKQSIETIGKSSDLIHRNIQKIFDNHEKYFWIQKGKKDVLPKVLVINNESWYKHLNVVDFISHVGRHFRVGTMLSKTSVQSRLSSEAGLNFSEFAYQTFQAYDWLRLVKEHNCRFQIGGSDQMGNIVAGHDLIKKVAGTKVYGITLPLITSEEGNKFGKSAGNAVWLSKEKTSPFDLYQFFIRTSDSDVEKLLKFFTFDPLSDIEHLISKHQDKPEMRIAQRKLAESVTLLIHGEDGLRSAQLATSALYDQSLDSLVSLTPAEIANVFNGASTAQILLKPGLTTLDLAMDAGCFNNESDARRIISAGGFYVNHQRVTNTNEILTKAVHILPNNMSLLRVGKRNYYVVQWLT